MIFTTLDTEMTGLDPRVNQPIEFAAVVSDEEKELGVIHLYIAHPRYTVEPFCMNLHRKAWEALENKEGVHFTALARVVRAFLESLKVSTRLKIIGRALDLHFLGCIPGFKIQEGNLIIDGLYSCSHWFESPSTLFLMEGDADLPDRETCIHRASMISSPKNNALDFAKETAQLARVGLRRIREASFT